MKLLGLLSQKFKFIYTEQLVNSGKRMAGVGKSEIYYGEGAYEPEETGKVYEWRPKGTWIVDTREEAKVFYPRLIAKQDEALRELKYGVTEEVAKFRMFRLLGLYAITFGTAIYGLVEILELKWPEPKPCKPCSLPGVN